MEQLNGVPIVLTHSKTLPVKDPQNVQSYSRGFVAYDALFNYHDEDLTKEKPKKLVFFHGTSSPVFYFLDKDVPMFIPTIELLKKGIVPLTGELENGISTYGVNTNGLSMAPFDYLSMSVGYSLKYVPPKSYEESFKAFQAVWKNMSSSYNPVVLTTKAAVHILRLRTMDDDKFQKEVKPNLVRGKVLQKVVESIKEYVDTVKKVVNLIEKKYSDEEVEGLFDTSYMKTIRGANKEEQWNFWKNELAKHVIASKTDSGGVAAFGAPFVYFYKEHKGEFSLFLDVEFAKEHARIYQERFDIMMNAINRPSLPLKLEGALKEQLENPIPVVLGISEEKLDTLEGFEPVISKGNFVDEVTVSNLTLGKQLDSIIIRSTDLIRLVNVLKRFTDLSVNIYCNDELFNKEF